MSFPTEGFVVPRPPVPRPFAMARVWSAVVIGLVSSQLVGQLAKAASPAVAEQAPTRALVGQVIPAAPSNTTAPSPSPPAPTAPADAEMDMNSFLDRLMMAESGGRSDARNPRSTAVGPFQFIERTWLDLARRIFPSETAALNVTQILAMRADLASARRGAEAYTNDNAAILRANGLEATFPRLRLAFLLGPNGAVRVLQAPPQMRVTALLGPAVASANPFMYGLSVDGLIARAARDLAIKPNTTAGIVVADSPAAGASGAKPKPPRVAVRCNLELPSCRRWQALAFARVPATKGQRKQLAARNR